MLDARRTTLQLPLMREVTALQKIRTLQDPGTSSSVTSGGSSGTGKNKKVKTFIGDPHKDAQALAIELSGKLAKSAKVPSLSDGSTSRPSKLQRRGEKNVKLDKLRKRRAMKAMTAEELGNNGGEESSTGMGKLGDAEMEPMTVDVRERIKRIESAFERSLSVTMSGELRKDGLIKELRARGRRDAELEQHPDDVVRSDDRWDGGLARREELAKKIIAERGSSVSSLSQLLGNHYGSSRSALDLLGMVADQEHRINFAGESLFESDEELNPMEMEMPMSRPRVAAPPPLMSRGKDELKRPRGRGRTRKKPGSAQLRERSINLARSGKSSARLTTHREPPPTILFDDELAVSELPEQNGCGIPWDWSRIHKYGGKAFLDLTGLTCTLPEGSKRHHGMEPLNAEHPHPAQSISSLDSDANALPLIIGEDAHDSDLAGYYMESGRPREIPQKQTAKGSSKRKLSLQSAVKDVPVVAETGSTSRSLRDEAAPEGHRTLTQKYRPKNFKEIVGQSVVVKSLSTAIMKSKVAPVYLFMGPRGTGKTSAARVFAAGLNCLSLDYARRPCGICRECGTMALNRSADVRQIDAASNADLASMRAMMGSFTPHARYKVFIVEGCDLLSTDIWNAFLKVLEEPPRNVVFILITTDAERIPVTATSRCQKFLFSKVKESDIVRRLELLAGKEGLTVEAGALSLIATRSDGSLRDAEIVLDQLCLLDKNVSIALVQELVGVLPDNKVLDLLDYALSANTVNTVCTLREVLSSGVEPLALVSQLGNLITDILAGSLEVDHDTRKEGFFNRDLSEKEEQHRLRLALKILSDAEKQLRVAADRATWLTAALLQFAPDRSFFPSEVNTSAAPSPVEPTSAGQAMNYPVYKEDPSEPDEAILAPEPAEVGETFELYAESKKHPTPEEVINVTTLSEQKLEEAWAGEPQQQVVLDDDGETSETQRAGAPAVEFQVFQDEALVELWKRVVWEVTPRNLKNLLQTHGRLVAAGVAVDGSCAVVELEFDYARDKHKAERSWRSICVAFQAVLSTAVELRIALSDIAPDETEAARIGETRVDMEPSPSAQPKSKEIVNEEDPNPDEAHVRDQAQAQGAPSRTRHRRRGTRSRKHRHTSEIVSSSDPSGISPRRPPNRRRRVKRVGAGKAVKAVTSTLERETATQASTSFTREIWDSISVDRKPGEKKLLSTMMEEPQSEIEDLESAQKKIMKQRNHVQFRNDNSLAIVERTTLIADLQRGLPKESSLCWKRPSPPPSDFLMRKSRVKSVRKAQGKALFLGLIPCRDTRITKNDAPAASMAPVPAIQAA